jgi:beta-lactamase class A
MIKLFIALAFLHKVQERKFNYTPFDRQRMEAIIRHSDNRAINYFTAFVESN